MINLRKIENNDELKMGMTLLLIMPSGRQWLEKVDCIDNNKVYTRSLHQETGQVGTTDNFIEKFDTVYEVTHD